jgi:hypothetical protein
MRVSLAKTLALLESRQEYMREPDQVFTVKSCESLASFDRATCSWKTLQQSFLTDSEPFSQTWSRWGMTAGGYAYEHPMSGRRITGTGGFCWPTPTTQETIDSMDFDITESGRRKVKNGEGSRGLNLARKVQIWPTVGVRGFTNDGDLMGLAKMCESQEEMNGMGYRASLKKKAKYWPTQTAHLAKETNAPSEANRNEPTIASLVGGQLNPMWVAWLMGFPIGWASLKDMETPKSHCKQQLPIDCLGESK